MRRQTKVNMIVLLMSVLFWASFFVFVVPGVWALMRIIFDVTLDNFGIAVAQIVVLTGGFSYGTYKDLKL